MMSVFFFSFLFKAGWYIVCLNKVLFKNITVVLTEPPELCGLKCPEEIAKVPSVTIRWTQVTGQQT